VHLTQLRGAARAVVGARLVEAHGGRAALFLTADSKRADVLVQDLCPALGDAPAEEGGRVRAFPRHDTPPYDRFSPQPFVTAQRMEVLHRLLEARADGPAPVIVAPWTALAARLPARDAVRSHSVRLEVGGKLDRDELVGALVGAGYTRQSLVEERGEIAVRGGILDFFPPQRARPVRLELLGDEIESIREFDPASQRSEGALERVVAAPPRELLFDRELVVERGDELRTLAEKCGVGERGVDTLVDSLLRGFAPPGAEALAPLLQPALESFLDFLPEDALVLVDEIDLCRERLVHYSEEVFENYDSALEGGRLVCAPEATYLGEDEMERELFARKPVLLESLGVGTSATEAEAGRERWEVRASGQDELISALRRSRGSDAGLTPLADQIETWREEGWRVVLAATSLSSADRLRRMLDEYHVRASLVRTRAPEAQWAAPGRVEVRIAALSSGFLLPALQLAVVSEEEIFGVRRKQRRRVDLREGAAIEALAQLAPGDHLVHAEHGIGVYRGLVPLALGGLDGEFLRLEYDAGDRLFVPVHRLNLVQRYVGADGQTPRLDRLGGVTWERAKRAVKKAVRSLARELVAVHAERELATGHAFPPRDEMLREFEAAFPYEETGDQLAAIEDVLGDLTQARPMDRLVCGDVGYGKTEVAARAAFRAVTDGKQVAVLVPTTVLCQQHAETFSERFADWPVRVESLSRFRTPKESKAVLEGLLSGEIDIVIGTHRLLQKSVAFRELGLLVVDEEHRFGVTHKERIKQLKKSVDVLTLTATPIPRTLQMAFSGLRDLSLINTAPPDRLAIRTQICRFDESLVRESILREVRRGGQVFFVHNRVHTIGSLAELLGRIVPEVRVIVAHGQMPERELENRMLAFMRGDAEVLLCTTIIESGLDIPRANTIVIDRADALGLAQLYQLRGRVGRSSHRAYAYLLIPGVSTLTPDARRRMEAIQDLAELGSGFRLANMDLEIRGAGNLLGAEQSGHMGAVGYETYMELLEETVEELRGTPRAAEVDPEIRLPVAARLPEAYVPEVSQRLVIYKRLASAQDREEVARIRDELLDRYGPLPREAENLTQVILVKLSARQLGLPSVDHAGGALVIQTGPTSRVDPARLVDLLNDPDSRVRMSPDQKILADAPDETPAVLFERALALLEALGALSQ
jgi:transcription-repair coupling factor (superfamily II helicase)